MTQNTARRGNKSLVHVRAQTNLTDRKIQAHGITYHTIPFIGRSRTGDIYQWSQKVERQMSLERAVYR